MKKTDIFGIDVPELGDPSDITVVTNAILNTEKNNGGKIEMMDATYANLTISLSCKKRESKYTKYYAGLSVSFIAPTDIQNVSNLSIKIDDLAKVPFSNKDFIKQGSLVFAKYDETNKFISMMSSYNVVNNLTSGGQHDPLSAEMGKKLQNSKLESGGVSEEYNTAKKMEDKIKFLATQIEKNPIGTILPFISGTIPEDYLLCDGREITKNDYSELYDILPFGGYIDEKVFRGLAKNEVPNMTGPTLNGYTITESSAFSATYPGWKAFDSVPSGDNGGWASLAGQKEGWVQIQYPNKRALSSFTIKTRTYAPGSKLEKISVYGVTTTSEEELFTENLSRAFTTNEKREFKVNFNKKTYDKFKIKVSAPNDQYCAIDEIELFTVDITQFPNHKQETTKKYLPDLRGQFLRGIKDGRKLLDWESEDIKKHNHKVPLAYPPESSVTNTLKEYTEVREKKTIFQTLMLDDNVNDNVYGRPIAKETYEGNETRPSNIGVNYIIKAKNDINDNSIPGYIQNLLNDLNDLKNNISKYIKDNSIPSIKFKADADSDKIKNKNLSEEVIRRFEDALTLSGKTRIEFENDIDTRVKYNSKKEIIIKSETNVEFIHNDKGFDPSNGELVPRSGYSISDYIDLKDVAGIYRTGSETKFNLWEYAFYDKDKKFIKHVPNTTDYQIVDYNGKKVTWLNLEPNAKYIRIEFEYSITMFTYHIVKNVKKIASYDVPKLTFDGEDILPQIPDGTKALEKVDSITEYIHEENILNPESLKTKSYYFDFSDGIKKIEAGKNVLITDEYILLNGHNIYVRQQGADKVDSDSILAIYCYNEEKYLGYISVTFKNISDKSHRLYLRDGTTKIRLYVNSSIIQSNSICLSFNELEKFYPYKDVLRLKDRMFSNIAEIVSENNILNPELLSNKGYYFDFSDGIKKITSSSTLIYEKYIPFNQSSIYIRQNGNETKDSILAIYCYNEEKYLGYISVTFKNISDKSHRLYLRDGTTKIRLYVNNSSIDPKTICISKKELDNFYNYEEILKIKEKYLPEIKFSSFKNKTIANFGDSIFGNKRPPLDVSTALANITGATVYNLGFGGCRMSQHSENWDAFSMYNLANSIADNNYSMQDSIDITATGLPKYFEETRTLLKSIDWLKVDIVTIAYGTNDFTASVNLDSDINKSDTTTFAGALRYSIEKLLGKYPHLKIFICTPTYRFWTGTQNEFIEDSDTKVINRVKLTDFVAKVKEVAKEYHLTSIDNYYELGINKFNRSKWFPVNDGTHHNPDGGVLLAEHIAKELF